ncbi:MAG TPA: phosphohistidine phosphatase SixA [Thermoanaerobaculia bacterium]|nr:phosphohistidine phosphatase SixA [Thermoanaerobaculia bacterium]
MRGFIVLLRHGIAEDKSAAKPDAERKLTDVGKRKMRRIAKTLARIFPEAEALYSSPLVRAVETSEAVQKAYGGEIRTETTELLEPGADVRDFRRLLADTKAQFAIFVGHEPNLTQIMLDLTSMRAHNPIELKKGGCYGLSVEDNSVRLEWMLPPRILREDD